MEPAAHPQRKSLRLPAPAYKEPGSACLVTIGTHDRAAVFIDHDLGAAVASILRSRVKARDAVLDAFCLMPDHAHVIVQIVKTGLADVIGDAKSCSTRAWWQHGGSGPLWQRSFHDHGLRHPNDYRRAVAYVLDNPVRADLVAD